MDYLTQSRNFSLDFNTKYLTHLSGSTQFPQITSKHNDLLRRNVTDFYPEHGSLRRSCTTLVSTRKHPLREAKQPVIIPLFKKSDNTQCLRAQLQELNGLKVPNIYSTSRNGLYTRYTVNEWIKSAQNIYGNSDRIRGLSEKIRGDSLRLGREIDDSTIRAQDDSSKKLDARILDINQLKSELDQEIDDIISETNKLDFAKMVTEKALMESENPLHIAQECIYSREKRAGIDLVHDIVEKELLKEIDTIKCYQDKMVQVIQKANNQLRLNRDAQNLLEKDSRDKYQALRIDEFAHNLNNASTGLAHYNGVETINNFISTPETWIKHTKINLEHSRSERKSSTELREEIEFGLNQCQDDMRRQWIVVNNALSKRIQETTDSRNKDQSHLKRILQEIFDMEKNIEYLKKSIIDKESPMKVAKTRIYTRLERPNLESCNDIPNKRLIQEVDQIKASTTSLRNQLGLAENALQTLLLNKSDLELDLNLKINSLFIDREKCLGIRKTFSIDIPIWK